MPQNLSRPALVGHSDSINSLFFNPDGSKLLSHSDDETAIVWNLIDGTVQRIFALQKDAWRIVAPPDWKTLISDRGQVFDLSSGQLLRTLRNCTGPLACSPDSKTLVSFDYSWERKGWDCFLTDLRFRNGKTRFPIGYCPDDIAFSTDSALVGLLVKEDITDAEGEASQSIAVVLYDLSTGALRKTLRGVSIVELHGVEFASTSARLIAEAKDGRIYDAETEQLLFSPVEALCKEYPNVTADIRVSALSKDSDLVALRTREGWIGVQDTGTSRLLWGRQGKRNSVRIVAFSPNASTLAMGSRNQIHLLDTRTGALLKTLGKERLSVEAVAFSQDGNSLTAIYEDNSARSWNLDGPMNLVRTEVEPFGLLQLGAPKTSDLARHLWNLPLSCLPEPDEGEPPYKVRAVSPDGSLMALSQETARTRKMDNAKFEANAWRNHWSNERILDLIIWNVKSRTVVSKLSDVYFDLDRFVFSSDNRMFAAIVNYYRFDLFDVQTCGVVRKCAQKRRLAPFERGLGNERQNERWSAPCGLRFSPDGKTLATGEPSFAVVLWDVAKGKIRRTIITRRVENSVIAFSPDSRTLAFGSVYHKETTVQGLGRRGKRRVLREHTASLYTIDFSPDGTRFASGGQDGTIRIWDIATGKVQAILIPEQY